MGCSEGNVALHVLSVVESPDSLFGKQVLEIEQRNSCFEELNLNMIYLNEPSMR